MKTKLTRPFWFGLSAIVSGLTLGTALAAFTVGISKAVPRSGTTQVKKSVPKPALAPVVKPTEPARFVPAKQKPLRKKRERRPAVHAAVAPFVPLPKPQTVIAITPPAPEMRREELPRQIELAAPNGAPVVLRRAPEARAVSDKELKLMAIESILEE